jgi:hypothetical protein
MLHVGRFVVCIKLRQGAFASFAQFDQHIAPTY